MRILTVHRIAALACFALSYYCFLDAEIPPETEGADMGKAKELSGQLGAAVFRNGECKAISVDEGEHTLTVIVPTANGCRVIGPFAIPAGTENVDTDFVTDYNGFDTLEYYWRFPD